MKKINNRIFSKKFKPFPLQREIIAHPARFKSCAMGRRWGKTVLGIRYLIHKLVGDPGEYAWIAPVYEIAERGISAMIKMVNPLIYHAKRSKPSKVDFCNGSELWYYSADSDDPKSILGHGFKGVVVDEAARLSSMAWNQNIRPTLSDNLGWALLLSSAKGRNWFFDQITLGRDPEEELYKSWNLPSNTSPFFPPQEWEEAKKALPTDTFNQEYGAEFLEDSAGVFKGIKGIIRPIIKKLNNCVIGCDLAKHKDFTTLVAMDRITGECHGFDRFNKLDWPVQKARIMAFQKRYGGTVYLDSTGVGDPIYDDLRAMGVPVSGFKFTSESKPSIIQALMVAIELGELSIPPEWETMIDELKRYEYQFSAKGHLTYNAPEGYHDDCVICLALANWGRKTPPVVIVVG